MPGNLALFLPKHTKTYTCACICLGHKIQPQASCVKQEKSEGLFIFYYNICLIISYLFYLGCMCY